MPVVANRPVTTHFYLCRHGQSEFNAKGILQGHLESPLTELGKSQARTLATNARKWNIQHIASSHLGRAQQTAEICAQSLAVDHESSAHLAEREFGQWQGQSINNFPEYSHFQQHCYQQLDLPAGNEQGYGETTIAVRQRMHNALHSLARSRQHIIPGDHSDKTILIVSHGDALACLMSLFTAPLLVNNTHGFKLTFKQNTLHWGGFID
ncbi:histidine phosphatase family protein [Paraglaciecola sp. L1A13]|uniref:histidine phosphatase family protein n=1 Tax=Paraglaciecola sp. L1A13 TaxID=2686359 RepID=UPI00131A660E|nr:histidine phosphatase family protein [Paraglaciecola sp. L1A13]